MEKLLGLGVEVIPVFPWRESLPGLRCYSCLRDVAGKIDVVQNCKGQEEDDQESYRGDAGGGS